MENQKEGKKINWLWVAIALVIAGVGFLIALNNRYEVSTGDFCGVITKYSCIKVFDKWTGKIVNK